MARRKQQPIWLARWRCTTAGCTLGGQWQLMEIPEEADRRKTAQDAFERHHNEHHQQDKQT